MTTIDGCISNLKGVKEWGLNRNIYGVSKIYDDADSLITKGMDARQVAILRESIGGYCVCESQPGMESLIRQLFEKRLVDELYLYVFSYTVGSGIPLFPLNAGVANYWKLEEAKVYNEEIVRLHYSRVDATEE